MISPELLRRYPFFGIFTDSQIHDIAVIAEQKMIDGEQILFESGHIADFLYFLVNGDLDIFLVVKEDLHPETIKEFLVGGVNPGEPACFSGLLLPYKYQTTVKSSRTSELIVIDAVKLRSMMDDDKELACKFMQQVSKFLLERLIFTRNQLAAAWA